MPREYCSMETLLPSEVARLVLGYLEEEKCLEAAKCFLSSSPNLSEHRSIAERGKKYPTKVNGYSLKEILEEYCLVHSIVQDSLSSMTEQPDVGVSMIDCLRFLVRACQPVQVHINLHPQQGQGAALNKSEASDTSSSARLRLKKTSSLHEQNTDFTKDNCRSESGFPLILPDSSSTQMLSTVNNAVRLPTPQLDPPHTSLPVTTVEDHNAQFNQRSNTGVDLSVSNQEESRKEDDCAHDPNAAHKLQQNVGNIDISQENIVQHENPGTYQKSSPLPAATEYLHPNPTLENSEQQMYVQVAEAEPVTKPTNLDFTPLSHETQSVHTVLSETGSTLKDLTKTEEPVRSYTITKCYGSNIVILDDDNTNNSQQPSTSFWNTNKTQDDESKKLLKDLSREVAKFAPYVIEHMVYDENMQMDIADNIAGNINKVRTPAKQVEDANSQGLGENLDVKAVAESALEETCIDQFLREFLKWDPDRHRPSNDSEDSLDSLKGSKRKKRTPKKKSKGDLKSKQLCENVNTDLNGQSFPAERSVEVNSGVGTNFAESVSANATPAKGPSETDSMTPMTKLLKSITSPSADLFIDPNQIAGILGMPDSATKTKDEVAPSSSGALSQNVQSQPVVGSENTFNQMIQVPQPNGTTVNVPIVFCESNQQVAKYVNERGVSTIFTGDIVIPHHNSFVPIVPKIQPGVPLPPSCFGITNTSQVPKAKRRPRPNKKVITRGGRLSAGQMHPAVHEDTPDPKDTVTLYADDGKDEVSSTVPYTTSSDLPILVSEVTDTPLDTPDVNPILKEIEPKSSCEDVQHEVSETDPPGPCVENKDESHEKVDNAILPLNATIRNTPGVDGSVRRIEKRVSLSTPRRRCNHIRALDFNTPPKDHDLSLRRANTSPKNMSLNALSPHTADRSAKSSVRGGLFKAPTEGSTRTSRVKAHLFKSPEYFLNLSSGFKIPPSAATSTPAEASLPPPSEEWDKIHGVSLILQPSVSPVKHSEPPCKRKLKPSWDSNLRSLCVSNEPEPDPEPLRKRKAATAASKKGTKRIKKSSEKEEKTKIKSKEDANSSQNTSNDSAGEMARMIENNLLEDSGRSTSLHNDGPPQSLTSPKNSEVIDLTAICRDRIEAPSPEKKLAKETENHENPEEKLEPVNTNALEAGEGKLSKHPPESHQQKTGIESDEAQDGLTLIANAALSISERNQISVPALNKKTSDVCKSPNSDGKVKTPVSDPSVIGVVDKIRLNMATWGESFSFETPMKDMLANLVPQTPRFADPCCASKEDTPCTKIIRALPFPLASTAENSPNTPVLSVPPTPTIHATAVSPFRSTRPSLSPNAHKIKDAEIFIIGDNAVNHHNLNTQSDCSGKQASESCKSADADQHNLSGEKKNMELDNAEEVCTIDCKEPSDASSSSQPSQEVEYLEVSDDQTASCARHRNYKWDVPKRADMQSWLNSTNNPNNILISKGLTSGEEDCQIVSPKKVAQSKRISPKELVTLRQKSEDGLSTIKDVGSVCKASSTTPPQRVKIIDSAEIEEALDQLHGKTPTKICSISGRVVKNRQTPLSHQKLPIMKPSPDLIVTTIENCLKDVPVAFEKTSLESPVKSKSTNVVKVPSSKKKSTVLLTSEQLSTDDESSETSSSESSSDSDSSTSSSEDDDTPIKEIPPLFNQSSPGKVLEVESQKTGLLESGHSIDVREGHLEKPERQENVAEKSKSTDHVELKTLLETKDVRISESLVRIRSAQNPLGADLKIELELKRQRMLDQLKSDSPRGRSVKNSKVKVTSSETKVVIPQNIVVEKEAKKTVQKEISKDQNISPKVSVKRPSKLEPTDKLAGKELSDNGRPSSVHKKLIMSEEGRVGKTVEQNDSDQKDPKESVKRLPKSDQSDMLTGKQSSSQHSKVSSETLKVPDTKSAKIQAHNVIEGEGKAIKSAQSRVIQRKKLSLKESAKNSSRSEPNQGLAERETSGKLGTETPTTAHEEVQKTLNISDKGEALQTENKNEISPKESTKRRSKSEGHAEKEPSDLEAKQRRSSDSAKISDDEEFKLHLSGDDREESPQTSVLVDAVEKQLAELHGDSTRAKTEGSTATKSSQVKTGNSTTVTSRVSDSLPKIPPRGKVSSQAADKAIKALMLKGFGYSLPPPPKEKIKKIYPNPAAVRPDDGNHAKSTDESKSETSRTADSAPFKQNTSKSSRKSEVEDMLSDEEGYTDVIDTSVSSKTLKIVYTGLGSFRPKQNTVILRRQRLTLDGGTEVCISPSPFLDLFEFSQNVRQVDLQVTDRKKSRSDIRAQNPSRSEFYRRYLDCRASGSSRPGVSRDQDSRDRSYRQLHATRIRMSRSPSPRLRRSNEYSDHGRVRDSQSMRDYHSRTASSSSSRRHGINSSHSRRHSDHDSNTHESSSSRPKVAETSDFEEGELLSSESDTETRRAKTKRRALSPRNPRTRPRRTSERSLKDAKTSQSPSKEVSSRTLPPQGVQSSSETKASGERKESSTKERYPKDEKKSTKPERSSRHESVVEDINEGDLDDVNFPILGDDDAADNNLKDSTPDTSSETNQDGMVTRRRAPPRSVNAHKVSVAENKTPVQRGKRKLSTSPDVVSGDSGGSVNAEAKAMRSSQRNRKSVTTPKVLKQSEVNGVADTDLLKKLDVEKFLAKLHGGES